LKNTDKVKKRNKINGWKLPAPKNFYFTGAATASSSLPITRVLYRAYHSDQIYVYFFTASKDKNSDRSETGSKISNEIYPRNKI
jgi:hypothetical protein